MDASKLAEIKTRIAQGKMWNAGPDLRALAGWLDEALDLLDAVSRYPCDVGNSYCYQHYEDAPCPVGQARQFVERLRGAE